MEFKINSRDLLNAAQIVATAIASNPALPILEDLLFEVDNNNLTITASDLEVSIKGNIACDSCHNFSVAIPSNILLNTLKGLPSQEVTFIVSDNNAIQILAGKAKYKIAGESGADYPSLPVVQLEQSVNLNLFYLKDSLRKTIIAAGHDDLRPAMTGVYMASENDKIVMVATDAHKLVRIYMDGQLDRSFILPRKGVSALQKIGGDSVNIFPDQSNVMFDNGVFKIYARLIDQKYPDYNAVIPKDNNKVVVVSKSQLLDSVKRILLFANKTTNQILFNIGNGVMTVSAQDLDFSNEASEQISVDYNGEEMTIGFNGKFLAELLPTIDTDDIVIKLSTPTKAAVLSPSVDLDTHNILIMPVMLSN